MMRTSIRELKGMELEVALLKGEREIERDQAEFSVRIVCLCLSEK